MPMKPHFFISDSDGHLYDTRQDNWSTHQPLRRDYRRTFSHIETAAQFKATLRAGAYAWPGGYPLYFICDDCEALCFKCGKSQLREIIPAIVHRNVRDWRVVAMDINYEDSDLYCDHCNAQIESAYGED